MSNKTLYTVTLSRHLVCVKNQRIPELYIADCLQAKSAGVAKTVFTFIVMRPVHFDCGGLCCCRHPVKGNKNTLLAGLEKVETSWSFPPRFYSQMDNETSHIDPVMLIEWHFHCVSLFCCKISTLKKNFFLNRDYRRELNVSTCLHPLRAKRPCVLQGKTRVVFSFWVYLYFYSSGHYIHH